MEIAQAFARLGSEVTLFDIQETILAREDEDAAKIVHDALKAGGVAFELGVDIERIS